MGQLVPYPQFIGGTYANRAFVAGDVERSINCYPSTIESGAGKNRYTLTRRPGLSLGCALPTSPLQALYSIGDLTIAISGGVVYNIQAVNPPTFVSIGTVPEPVSGNYYSIAANNNQILILCNDATGSGYIVPYSPTVTAPVKITSDGFTRGMTCTQVDGYFIANQGNNSTFQVSNLNDGTTWQGINDQNTNDYPDALSCVVNFLHYLQLFGTSHSEAYYDTGSNSTIFARYEGSYQYIGIAAPWSVAYLDNSVFWLGQDDRGQLIVYRLDGFTPKRVSDYSFESAVQQYPRLPSGQTGQYRGLSPSASNAYAYSYQEGGHLFYVISFPNGNAADGTIGAGATWVYDVNEKKWHERAAWVTETTSPFQSHYAADIARFHTFGAAAGLGIHLVGGGDGTGNVYVMSLANPDDNGKPLRWLRRAPHLYTENVRNFYHQFILNMQVGAANQGQDPMISLQYSQDGGQTWSAELQTTTGKVGEYKHRVVWDQLGFGRDYVFQVFGSDPTPSMVMSDAYLYLSQGIS